MNLLNQDFFFISYKIVMNGAISSTAEYLMLNSRCFYAIKFPEIRHCAVWRQATPCSSAQLSYSRHHQQGRTGVALCGVSQSLSFAKIYLVLSVYQVFLFLKAWPRETEEKEKNLVKSSFDLSNQELQCLETKPRADKIVIIFKKLVKLQCSF